MCGECPKCDLLSNEAFCDIGIEEIKVIGYAASWQILISFGEVSIWPYDFSHTLTKKAALSPGMPWCPRVLLCNFLL